MKHCLFKYYDERKWAEDFLDGKLCFRPLSYFQSVEDEFVRRDDDEGRSIFRPVGGLEISNVTQGNSFTITNYSFESVVKKDEIFAFCASQSFNELLKDKFNSVACIAVHSKRAFYERLKNALPKAKVCGGPISYYREADNCTPRWALPEVIATSKLRGYQWQDEYRVLFSETDALEFEKVETRLVAGAVSEADTAPTVPFRIVDIGDMRDICSLHLF